MFDGCWTLPNQVVHVIYCDSALWSNETNSGEWGRDVIEMVYNQIILIKQAS
jgi:hypothetical protein